MIAITRAPASTLQSCQRTYVPAGPIDLALATAQHQTYCRVLTRCGANVMTLPAIDDLPDSTFVEDTAIVLDELAILCSMGAAARREEPQLLAPALRVHRELDSIHLPATIDGGDVLRLGRTLLVGRSCRTNDAAIAQLAQLTGRFGYRVAPIPVRGCLHLKTACAALPDGRLIVNPQWLDTAALAPFPMLEVSPSEPWAANVLLVGERVVLDAAHTATAGSLERLGFPVERCDLSEFAKAEGGVTCLSLLITEPTR